MPDFILTERLHLRPYAAADFPALQALHCQVAVSRWLGDGQVPEDGQIQARLAAYCRPRPAPQGVYAITLRMAPERALGTLLLLALPLSAGEAAGYQPELEIGWHLHPDYWGKGYATEAARAVLAAAPDLTQVYAVTYPENQASQAVMRRLDMTEIGLSRRYYDTELLLFGKVL